MASSDDEVATRKRPLQDVDEEKQSPKSDEKQHNDDDDVAKRPKKAAPPIRSHYSMRSDIAADPNAKRVKNPKLDDVLFGRGRGFQENPGNQRMLDIIDGHRKTYRNQQRNKKREFVEAVYDEITKDGARFLKKLEEENCWVEVSIPLALEKISHTLRGKRKGNQGFQQSDTTAVNMSISEQILALAAGRQLQQSAFNPLQSASTTFPSLPASQNAILSSSLMANQYPIGRNLQPTLTGAGISNSLLSYYASSRSMHDTRLVPDFARAEMFRQHQLVQAAAQSAANSRLETQLGIQQQQQEQIRNTLLLAETIPDSIFFPSQSSHHGPGGQSGSNEQDHD